MAINAKKHLLSICVSAALAVVAAVMAMLIFLTPGVTVYAAELGAETPEIYCTYFKDNEEVDGNRLTAGTYDVSFNIQGVENVSVLQLTATYDSSVTIDSSSISLISDNQADVTSMGPVVDNAGGNLVLGFVSDNGNYSGINPDGQVLATMSVTFATDCDAEDVIVMSTNPHYTFGQVNYEDSHANEYSLVTNEEAVDYNGVLYPMTCDITPSKGHDITGSLVSVIDSKGNTSTLVPYGSYTIKVYETPDFETAEPVKTINTVYTEKTENTEASNLFTIDALPTGTYYVSISSAYSLKREDIVITMGNENIDNVVIPIVVCDYNQDGYVTLADASNIYANMSMSEPSCDLNGDTYVTLADASYVYSVIGVEYNGFEIK